MSTVKIIEVLATSENSFEEATEHTVVKAVKNVQNIKSAYVMADKERK